MAEGDRTLSPYAVGGRRFASLATQPLVVDFLDIATRGVSRAGVRHRFLESLPADQKLPLGVCGDPLRGV